MCASPTSTPAPENHNRFPSANRLTRKADLEAVLREGKRIRSRRLDVRVRPSPLSTSRIGIIVPRHGKSAVDRNTLKRRLKEIVRLDLLPGLAALDIVIRARSEAYQAPFEALVTELKNVRTAL